MSRSRREDVRSSDADVRTFCYKKQNIFRKLWCDRTDKGGEELKQCRHFADKGKGEQFLRLCADVFYRKSVSGILLVLYNILLA